MRDAFAQASGPIVIGHHCDLTGVISSWGVWHDKAAKAAVDIINQGGGIAGRKVELATEDTESNPAPGARKLRNLIQRSNAEFVVGSVHSGVMLAALPIASELKTIYFSTGEATEATGSKGSRYSFRTGTDTYSIAAASMPWAVESFGKAWTIIYADYAWGQSTDQELKAFIERAGGKVLKSIAVPLDTKDFVPYLAQIPADTEVLLPAFIGSLSVAFYTQAKNMGLDKKMKMISSSASIELIAPDDIQGAAEGVYFFENFPRMLKAKDDEFHKEFNKRIGIDDVACARDRRPARHGQEPWLAGVGGHLRPQGGDREVRLQDPQGRRGRDPGARRHGDEELARPSARRQAHPQGGPRRHHRLLHQPRGGRKVRGQEEDPEGRTRQEHAAAARSFEDAGVIERRWRV